MNYCANCGCMLHHLNPSSPSTPAQSHSKKPTRQRTEAKKPRKPNAHSIAYGEAFKKIEHKYKKKKGGWKKDGFKNCSAAARRMVKKGK